MDQPSKKIKIEEISVIENLPTDNQRSIMSKLPLTDVIHYCEASKTLNENCNDKTFWKFYARKAAIDINKYDEDRDKLRSLYLQYKANNLDATKYYDLLMMYMYGYLALNLAMNRFDIEGVKYILSISKPNNYYFHIPGIIVLPSIFEWMKTVKYVKSKEQLQKHRIIFDLIVNAGTDVNATFPEGRQTHDFITIFIRLYKGSSVSLKYTSSFLQHILFKQGYYPYRLHDVAQLNTYINDNINDNEDFKNMIIQEIEKVTKIAEIHRSNIFGGKKQRKRTKKRSK